ncbi:hypothetical protein VB711_08150 [Cronbergia sp. UHCC 0137]|uniref:hypothetical protein n=1 Tax=Cronbergia sp. UHCC 0137 TaxID=3110239 RepID=UPI002B220124|nr:hypothetical protein [Cronbergia sp. UHCC 0137]MEA5617808.1 hypothetical protein [Cronbergia sp. UHCC 0137]
MTTNTSTIDELIKEHNPFAGHIVVRPPQIWGKSFPDVPSINAHASDAVFDAIDKINKKQRQTVGITITAEKGLGKSQIISRVRHQLQTKEDSIFIYMSRYDNLNQIQYQFLQNVTSSLRAFSKPDVMQWQEIATALLNEIAQKQYTPEQYISIIFPNWGKDNSIDQIRMKIDKLRTNIEQRKPEISNSYIIQAILWTLYKPYANYANFWLSGQELPEEQAQSMGLPNPKNQNRESEALSNVRQILDIVSNYRTPVICFDELDITNIADNGFTAAQIIADLAKDLYNNLKKGVLLLAMYPETWNAQVRALPHAEAVIDRLVSEQSNRQPIALLYLNSDDILNLVKIWLQDFYQQHQQTPPHPFYPFDENKLKALGKTKPTIRSVLKWCAENFNTSGTNPPKNLVKPFFQSGLINIENSMNLLIEDELAIAAALKVAFISLAKDKVELENVKVEGVEDIIANRADQGYLNFRVVGNNRNVKIGILVLQQSGGKYIGAALKRLIEYEKFDLTRGCLIRSKTISPGAYVPQQCLQILLKKQSGEWVILRREDIKPLLAISSIYYNCRNYELTEEQIFDFMKQEKIVINNPLIREILSDPSGQEPTNLTDDGLPISIPQNVDNTDNIEFDF